MICGDLRENRKRWWKVRRTNQPASQRSEARVAVSCLGIFTRRSRCRLFSIAAGAILYELYKLGFDRTCVRIRPVSASRERPVRDSENMIADTTRSRLIFLATRHVIGR